MLPPIPLASGFLAGGILSLLVPAGLLVVVALWHTRVVRRVHDEGLPGPQAPGTPPPVTDEELPHL